jgi:hypothetical protein
MRWRRRASLDPPLSRADVLVIIEALADIKAWTHEIRDYLLDGDDEEEEDA